jgi:hypothetical protein
MAGSQKLVEIFEHHGGRLPGASSLKRWGGMFGFVPAEKPCRTVG